LQTAALAGVALLRMHASRNPTRAREIAVQMRRLLERLDVDITSPETSTPMIDVVSGYDRWAQVYDLPGNPLIECEEPVVRPILDAITGDPVLDAACGTGRHLAHLAGDGHHVIGVDISPGMLDKARAKVS
jgi:SAM-dependent methyltransferase